MAHHLDGPGLKLGLGLLSIGRAWGVAPSAPPSESEAQALLAKALELGITIFDTAPAYAQSEARLGRFLTALEPSARRRLTIMTKAGEHWDFERGSSFVDHSRDALVRSIDRSLSLLGTIDVLQIHKATSDVVTDPDVIAAMEHARRCGVTAFGASVSDVEAGRLALESGMYDALQFPLNMLSQTMAPLLPELESSGRAAIVNRPFAMGGLLAEQPFEEAAKAAFRYIEKRLPRAVILTGTGNVAHLAQNLEAFQNRSA
ncbi:aryl-alcohol dehydrogenase-like predicted oxidoreductase [Microvirga lupini]|uniref:Aryl-alcohol dehydrogenase-like predicted oxidoreductase n=1 Tax=Microvirga lupini TaxID=420324 RepID=A0A7W4VLM5_9HYPH|nr:aldo/keto reductase [Microvirga lupini]MBB3019452.1 aryl-alcohol dehydrogenase-like predicted oxidoreductase [Microvirga lupini]